MKNVTLITLCSMLLCSCMEPMNKCGIVERVYEVPTYKAYSIDNHVVVRDTVGGVGYDLTVENAQMAAQYQIGKYYCVGGYQ